MTTRAFSVAKIGSGRFRWIAALVLWIALVAELLIAIRLNQPWLTGDSRDYLSLADGLRHGYYGTRFNGVYHPDVLRPPGYPMILAALQSAGFGPKAIVSLQGGLYLAALYCLQRTLRRQAIEPLMFLGLAVVCPFAALYATQIMSEAWALVLLTLGTVLIISGHLSSWKAISIGILAGFGVLLRSDLLLLPVAFAAMSAVACTSDPLRQRLRGTAVILSASLAVVSPYVVWNWAHFHRFTPTPLASASGNTLYLATWQQDLSYDDFQSMYKGQHTEALQRSGLLEEVKSLNMQIGAAPETIPFNPADYGTEQLQIQSSKVFGAAALARIRAQPGSYLKHVIYNCWALWNTSRIPSSVPRQVAVVIAIVSGTVYILGIVGAALSFVIPNLAWARPCVGAILYMPAVHVWFHTEARYTAAARPLLLLFAAIALAAAWKAWSGRSARPGSFHYLHGASRH